MRTTISVDARVLEELAKATGERSQSAALKLRELKEEWLAARTEDVGSDAREADLRREGFLERLRAPDGHR